MDNAIIIEPNDDVIDIGDKITILTGDIEAEEITLVLYDGRALEKRISIESEFGKILVGHKIGDKIPYRTETVQILGIQKAYKEKDNVLTKQL
jgi:transcription elongation GreA/GreB family factor